MNRTLTECVKSQSLFIFLFGSHCSFAVDKFDDVIATLLEMIQRKKKEEVNAMKLIETQIHQH